MGADDRDQEDKAALLIMDGRVGPHRHPEERLHLPGAAGRPSLRRCDSTPPGGDVRRSGRLVLGERRSQVRRNASLSAIILARAREPQGPRSQLRGDVVLEVDGVVPAQARARHLQPQRLAELRGGPAREPRSASRSRLDGSPYRHRLSDGAVGSAIGLLRSNRAGIAANVRSMSSSIRIVASVTTAEVALAELGGRLARVAPRARSASRDGPSPAP